MQRELVWNTTAESRRSAAAHGTLTCDDSEFSWQDDLRQVEERDRAGAPVTFERFGAQLEGARSYCRAQPRQTLLYFYPSATLNIMRQIAACARE